ncbi:2-oxo acid dehydrogenase subunit E2 [Helcococcus kunzii]
MIFRRKDGYKVKDVDAFTRFIPLIMKHRNDALVMLNQEIDLAPIDDYIKKVYLEKGIRLSYMHIIYAAMARTYVERPKINQFIMNGRYYMRNDITFSMVVKKEMSLEADETIVKLKFKGDETPIETKDKLNTKIEAEKDPNTSGNNATDLLIKTLSKTPLSILKFIVFIVKYLDKVNLIPSKVIEASPFHASAFITNLGSIGLDAALHHIYNFGTVGAFLSIGKKNRKISKKNNEFVEEKIMNVGFVIDERICDGFYYASAMRRFFRYLNDPEKLEEPINMED